MKMNNFKNYVAYCEALGLSKCWEAYANFASAEDIFEVGFNANSGYVYISLINGITICSMLGQNVVFQIYNPETDEEIFCDVFEEAVKSI